MIMLHSPALQKYCRVCSSLMRESFPTTSCSCVCPGLGTFAAWKSFATRFGGTGGVYANYAARKPIMIAEYGSVEQGGDKGQWYRDMLTSVRNQFPSIAALVAWDSIDGSANFEINTSSGALAGYEALASNAYFNPPRRETISRTPTIDPANDAIISATSVSFQPTRS